jgi:hypothetical protein
MLLRIFNDTSPLINMTLKQQQEKKAAAQNGEDKVENAIVKGAVESEADVTGKPEEAETLEEQVAQEDLPGTDEASLKPETVEEAA